MTVSELIQGKLVLVGMTATLKDEAIRELVDFLIRERAIPEGSREPVLDAVFSRERVMSTGMEKGVALPHGVTDAVPSEVVAIGLSGRGIAFETIDGEPVRILVLHLAPRSQSLRRVRTLSRIVRMLHSDGVRTALTSSGAAPEAIGVIRSAEADLA